jgi:hypothetical protein
VKPYCLNKNYSINTSKIPGLTSFLDCIAFMYISLRVLLGMSTRVPLKSQRFDSVRCTTEYNPQSQYNQSSPGFVNTTT